MSAFSSRTTGYKIGVVLLVFSLIMFLVGYAAPYWKTLEYSQGSSSSVSYDEGLWMYCVTLKILNVSLSVTTCTTAAITGYPDWFLAVRALACLGFIGLFISCVYALVTNCCRAEAGPRTRILEALAACSGALAFTGCMLYVGYLNDNEDEGNPVMVAIQLLFRMVKHLPYDTYFDWAFYMASVGSGLSIVAAIIICICNKVVPPSTTHQGGGTVIVMQNYNPGQVQGQPGYYGQAQPGYVGYGYPAAAGPVKAAY